MNKHDRSWFRLAALARRAPRAEEVSVAPPGFATRVAARWMATRRSVSEASIWEWLSVRSLAVACAITVVSTIVAWPAFSDVSASELADLADPLSPENLPPS
jgi:hypothetical protein